MKQAEAQVVPLATTVAILPNRMISASFVPSNTLPPGEFRRTPDTRWPLSFADLMIALRLSVSPSAIPPAIETITLPSLETLLVMEAAVATDCVTTNALNATTAPSANRIAHLPSPRVGQ